MEPQFEHSRSSIFYTQSFNRLFSSLPVSRRERVGPFSVDIEIELMAQKLTVNGQVAAEHFQPAGNPLIFEITIRIEIIFAMDRYAIRHAPAITLADRDAHLFHRGDSLFVRRAQIAEKFTAKFVPVMIEEILQAPDIDP